VNLYALAVLYLQSGQAAEAEKLAVYLLRLNPGNQEYRQLMAQFQ
jgi:predicted Zn-dependent protease